MSPQRGIQDWLKLGRDPLKENVLPVYQDDMEEEWEVEESVGIANVSQLMCNLSLNHGEQLWNKALEASRTIAELEEKCVNMSGEVVRLKHANESLEAANASCREKIIDLQRRVSQLTVQCIGSKGLPRDLS